MTHAKYGRSSEVMVIIAVAVVLLAGCGSSSDSTSSSGSATAGSANTSSTTSSAAGKTSSSYRLVTTPAEVSAAVAAATHPALPKLTKPGPKTIALIQFDGQSTSSQRVEQGVKDAVAALGYKFITCDPGGNAQQVATCASSMVSQHPDLILSYFQQPSELGNAIQTAAQEKIPWIAIGSPVAPSPDMSQYALPTELSQDAIDQWMVKHLKPSSGRTQAYGMTATSTGGTGVQEKDGFDSAMKSEPYLDWVGDHDLDLGNLQQDTISATKSALTSYPNLGAIWTVCDLCVPLVAQTVDAADRSGVKVFGDFSTPETVSLIRSGKVDAVVDNPWEVYGWIALDRALTHWATGQPLAGASAGMDYPMRFGLPYVLSKANTGSGAGPAPVYGPDFQAYFKAKWKAEFGQL